MAWVGKLVIAGASLAAAVLAGSDALVRVMERKSPQIVAWLPVNNGMAQAEWAEDYIVLGTKPPTSAGQEPTLQLAPQAEHEVKRLSRLGYRQEPLNYTAMRNLGMVAAANGDVAAARTMFLMTHELTRRDLGTNTWLARDFAQREDGAQALATIDQALRTSQQAQQVLLPALLQSLRNDALVPAVIDLLQKSPPWRNAFWGAAPRFPQSLGNIAKVREAMARAGSQIAPDYDRTLISELANHGHLAVADRLVSRLVRDDRPAGEIVRNSDFDKATVFSPFGWELFFDSSLSTDISQSQGVMRVSTFADGGGRFARQVVALPSSHYTLLIRSGEWDQLDEGAVYVRFTCAETPNAPASVPISVNRPNFSVTFRKPRSDCDYYWLTLFALPRDDRQDNVVVLESVSMRAAQAAD